MIEKIFKPFVRKRHRYRIEVTNDDTYSHILTFYITSKVLFWTIFSLFIGIIFFTFSIIIFSPLKYYIPGLDYANQRENIEQLKSTIDELQQKVEQQDQMYSALQLVIKDDVKNIHKFDSLFFKNNIDSASVSSEDNVGN